MDCAERMSEQDEKMAPEEAKPKVSWPFMTAGSFGTALVVRAAAVGLIWGLGYMHWSFAWLIPPVVLSVWKIEGQKHNALKRLTAQATAMANEKEVIINRMDELPSWVYFPDFDRAEWLNKVFYKIWPGMNHFVRNLIKESIQPALVESLSQYKMPAMQFERIVLGRIPPKVYGIKVYEKNTSRNEIIMDCDIMYAGDCDITFLLGSIKGGIRDFQIRGMLRIVMKPMLTVVPLVGGIQAFFLNNPSVDFNLVGMADILEFPGFNQILRKIVKQQFAAIMVLPNKIIVPLTKDIPAEAVGMPEPEGVLRIHVVQAKHLMKKDIGVLGKGKSDPYAVISIGAQEFRTKTIDNTVDPKWDYWCEFIVEQGSSVYNKVLTQLFDKDHHGPDDRLGRATIEVNRVKKLGTIDTWFTLEFAKHGMVQLRLSWLSLTKNKADLQTALVETQQLRVTSMSTAVLIVFIDSARNLPCLRGSKQPDVYLEASVGSRSERTRTILRSSDPIWEQGFSLLVANPETSTLNIKIMDDKTATEIATLAYNLSTLLKKDNLEDMQQPYVLESAVPDSKLTMSLSLRILKYEQPENIKLDEDDMTIEELNKKIERQESTASGESAPVTPLKKQMSKESLSSSSVPSKTDVQPTLAEEFVPTSEEDIIIASSVPANVQTPPGLVHRLSTASLSQGEWKLGRIQLTLRYSINRQHLVVVVHRIANLPLPLNDPSNIPDPYVKMYLLPDRHKETKRKTVVMKDNCNPVYDEQFEYVVSQGDINSRILQISVCTQKGWLSSGTKIVGQVHVNLAEVDVSQAVTKWYDLMPEVKE